MTPIARLLRQKRILCLHAFEQTGDLNEAHLLVHEVMTTALRRVDGPEQDLSAAMAHVLDVRARRRVCLEAMT